MINFIEIYNAQGKAALQDAMNEFIRTEYESYDQSWKEHVTINECIDYTKGTAIRGVLLTIPFASNEDAIQKLQKHVRNMYLEFLKFITEKKITQIGFIGNATYPTCVVVGVGECVDFYLCHSYGGNGGNGVNHKSDNV